MREMLACRRAPSVSLEQSHPAPGGRPRSALCAAPTSRPARSRRSGSAATRPWGAAEWGCDISFKRRRLRPDARTLIHPHREALRKDDLFKGDQQIPFAHSGSDRRTSKSHGSLDDGARRLERPHVDLERPVVRVQLERVGTQGTQHAGDRLPVPRASARRRSRGAGHAGHQPATTRRPHSSRSIQSTARTLVPRNDETALEGGFDAYCGTRTRT